MPAGINLGIKVLHRFQLEILPLGATGLDPVFKYFYMTEDKNDYPI
jgi:hypothetical protein